MSRRKDMPPDNMATISRSDKAIFEVKKMQAMKVNSPLNWLMKKGMKLR